MSIIKSDEQLYDVRLVERHIKKGLIKRKDYERYLKSLNESGENASIITGEKIFDDQPSKIGSFND